MRRLLIAIGILFIALGAAWPWLSGLGLGRLPGDIRIERPGFTFYLPLGSSLLVSVVLSVVLTVLAWLFRR
jgi:hypothetical protein